MGKETEELQETIEYLQTRVGNLALELENARFTIYRLQKRLDESVSEKEEGTEGTESN